MPMLSWMTTQQRGQLIRRSLGHDRELAYYVVYAPFQTPLADLAKVAGRRWAVEEGFEASKQLVGLGDYEVRRWAGWYRHVTLALFSHTHLAVLRQAAITVELKKEQPLHQPLRCRPSGPGGLAALDGPRDSPATARLRLAPTTFPPLCTAVVLLAPTTPSQGQAVPLPPHT